MKGFNYYYYYYYFVIIIIIIIICVCPPFVRVDHRLRHAYCYGCMYRYFPGQVNTNTCRPMYGDHL